MKTYLEALQDSKCIKILIIIIVLDIIFGVLRSIKEHCTNSSVGSDGLIRKFGMLVAGIGFLVLDIMLKINFIGFIPETVREYLPLSEIGLSSVCNILFIVFELLSVLKNMYKCGVPIPKKLGELLKRILQDFTSEIKEETE